MRLSDILTDTAKHLTGQLAFNNNFKTDGLHHA